jgi:hypothetical protein
MYKIPLTYEDPFDEDQPKTEIAYFHLTMLECLELEESVPGGLGKKYGNLKEDNIKEVMEFFRILIRASYGVKEGASFVKRKELTDKFMSGPAFEVLFFKLLTDTRSNTEFVTKVMPKQLFTSDGKVKSEAEIMQAVRDRASTDLQLPQTDSSKSLDLQEKREDELPWARREPTQKELMNMTPLQMVEVYERKAKGWTPEPAS